MAGATRLELATSCVTGGLPVLVSGVKALSLLVFGGHSGVVIG